MTASPMLGFDEERERERETEKQKQNRCSDRISVSALDLYRKKLIKKNKLLLCACSVLSLLTTFPLRPENREKNRSKTILVLVKDILQEVEEAARRASLSVSAAAASAVVVPTPARIPSAVAVVSERAKIVAVVVVSKVVPAVLVPRRRRGLLAAQVSLQRLAFAAPAAPSAAAPAAAASPALTFPSSRGPFSGAADPADIRGSLHGGRHRGDRHREHEGHHAAAPRRPRRSRPRSWWWS